MSFREHIGELRTVLMRISAVLLLGFLVGWEFRVEIFEFLSAPITQALADNGVYHYQAISITESVVVYLKSVLVADLMVFSPVIFHQLWLFVGPGLLRTERNFLVPVTFFSVVFFLIGAAFAHTVIVPFITDWLVKLTLEEGGVSVLVTMQNAYSVSFTFLFMFGLVFELPLVIYFLALFGTVTHTSLIKFFRYFVVLSFILAAILTPPDPVSQLMMAIPLNVLYGFGILVAYGVGRAKRRVDASRDEGGMTDKKVATESVRLLGGGFVLVGVAVALLIGFAQTLPATPLTSLIPQEATAVMGYNPSVLKSHAALDRWMERETGHPRTHEILESAGMALDEVKEVVMFTLPTGDRAALVRHEDIGELRDTLLAQVESMAEEGRGLDLAVIRTDANTLAFGGRDAIAAIAEVVSGDAEAHQSDEFEARLLGRVKAAGPLWAWLPHPEASAGNILSPAISKDVLAVGAWVKAGDDPSLSVEFRAADPLRADTTEARLDGQRMNMRQRRKSQGKTDATAAIRLLLKEALKSASPQARSDLLALGNPSNPERPATRGSDVPFMRHLAPWVSDWSIRRNDEWITLTTELPADGLPELLTGVLTH